MPQRISKKTLYLNADRTKLVPEGHEDAAFLFVREGSAVNESEAARLEKNGVKVNLSTDEHQEYDAVADHEAKHGDETQATADARRRAMMEGQPDPDGEPVEGERSGVKAKAAAPENKAKTAAENK